MKEDHRVQREIPTAGAGTSGEGCRSRGRAGARTGFARAVAAALAALFLALAPVITASPAASLGPVPSAWPYGTLQLGVMNKVGGASIRVSAPIGIQYQYLAGGVNKFNWVDWNPGGSYVTQYIQDSINNQMMPAFTYYMIYQSNTSGGGEQGSVLANLNNTSLMADYYRNVKLFYERAGAFPTTKVLFHFEPDMWGYMQQKVGDDAAASPVKVAATGISELQGLPDNAVGLAQALKKLRDTYAPNVLLGYHMSFWGTNVDPVYNDPTSSEVVGLATRSANFYKSLKTAFDVTVAEFSDRDAAFHEIIYGRRNAFYTASDYDNHVLWLSTYGGLSGQRLVVWQIPFGNTKMRAMNNTWWHFQDNIVETLLDDPGRTRLNEYLNAGVIAFLFGGGADGTTSIIDEARDGVTNPPAINGNNIDSYSADDDGGFFRAKAKAYYAAGAPQLPGAAASPPPPPADTSPPSVPTGLLAVAASTSRIDLSWTASSDNVGVTGYEILRDGVEIAATTATSYQNTGLAAETSYSYQVRAKDAAGNASAWSSAASAKTLAAPAPVIAFTSSASVSPAQPKTGQKVTVSSSVTNRGSAISNVIVDIEIYNGRGSRVFQQYLQGQSFASGQTRTYTSTWTPSLADTYTVHIGTFNADWSVLYYWNSNARTFTVKGNAKTSSLNARRG